LPTAWNGDFEHDARVEGAPTVGCEPLLDGAVPIVGHYAFTFTT
jgi:hypothetical protein